MVSYHLDKFTGNKHSSSGNILVLVCHRILQDHMNKVLGNFMGRSPSR